MIYVWIVVWVAKGMPEVQFVTGWNLAGAAFCGVVLVDLVTVLWSHRRALADLHLFGRTYVPEEGWVRDPHHEIGAE